MEKILHLTLKKKWFDMIASGEKKEEYREIKPYWKKRLQKPNTHPPVMVKYDYVKYTNGYSKTSRTMTVKCGGVRVGFGKPEWGGDPNNFQYVISNTEIISKNF